MRSACTAAPRERAQRVEYMPLRRSLARRGPSSTAAIGCTTRMYRGRGISMYARRRCRTHLSHLTQSQVTAITCASSTELAQPQPQPPPYPSLYHARPSTHRARAAPVALNMGGGKRTPRGSTGGTTPRGTQQVRSATSARSRACGAADLQGSPSVRVRMGRMRRRSRLHTRVRCWVARGVGHHQPPTAQCSS